MAYGDPQQPQMQVYGQSQSPARQRRSSESQGGFTDYLQNQQSQPAPMQTFEGATPEQQSAYQAMQGAYQRHLGRPGSVAEYESHLNKGYDPQSLQRGFQNIQYSQEAQQRQQQTAPGSIDATQAATQFQSMYGRAPSQQDIQRFQAASGWSGQGPISQQQYQQGMQAMSGFMQQEGNLGAVQMAQVGQPGQVQTFEQSRQQGQQLVGQYQPSQQTQQLQGQAGQTAMNLMQQGPMQFQAPTGGPTPDFTQQQQLISQLQQGQAPQSNQALMQQQRGAINQIQGMQAGPFQAPEAVAQAERNRVLQAVMGQPEVFGQQQQAQMAEQQKEQLLAQQKEAESRMSQLMASRGLSARGGADLGAQMGLQENLMSGLLAGQRDIALKSAEANRAAQLGAIQAVTGAQQADMARAAQGFQTGLEGQRFNLGAQQTAAQLAGQAGQQEFQQALQSGQFGREGQLAALQGAATLANQQMAQNQQQFQQGLGAFQANLGAQGQFGQQQLNAAQLANQMGQQGFSNYLAQTGLGLQGFGAAEAAAMARAQFGQGNYMDALRYNLQARGQEQDYALQQAQQNRLMQQALLGLA